MTNDRIETMRDHIDQSSESLFYMVLDHIDEEVFKVIEEYVVAKLNWYQQKEPNFCVYKDFRTTKLSEHKFAISVRIDRRCIGAAGTVPTTARKILTELFYSDQAIPLVEAQTYPSEKVVVLNVMNKEAALFTVSNFSKVYIHLCMPSKVIPKYEVERLIEEISKRYGDGVRMFMNWNETLENTLISMLLAYDSATSENPYPKKYPIINHIVYG